MAKQAALGKTGNGPAIVFSALAVIFVVILLSQAEIFATFYFSTKGSAFDSCKFKIRNSFGGET